MFDKNEIEKYQNIKAPASLKTRIEDSIYQENFKTVPEKRFSFNQLIRTFSAVAACLVLVAVVMTVWLTNQNYADLYLNGEEITSSRMAIEPDAAPVAHIGEEARMKSTIAFPLEIKVKGDAEIAVSGGELFKYEDGEPISCGITFKCSADTEISWVVENQIKTYIMTVKSNGSEVIYILEVSEDAPNGVIYRPVKN